jgi:hypothetical protein
VVDLIYIAACSRDSRFTRICVASIRFFYPSIPIKILAGSKLRPALLDELRFHWGVQTAAVPGGDYGWGFVKLEPLFGKVGERFLMLDSDTVITGPVLDLWGPDTAQFLVDDEKQTEETIKELYYDWKRVREVDCTALPPRFVFNSGQWFGTAGVLTRHDFALLVDWSSTPPQLRHPRMFMPGEQGILNYVLNQKAMLAGVPVNRRTIMRWPGHGMDSISVQSVAARTAPPLIVHWAGMKKSRLGAMAGGDMLCFFEHLYYSRMPAARAKQFWAGVKYPVAEWRNDLSVRLRQRWQMIMTRLAESD